DPTQELRRDLSVDQNRVQGVAHRWPAGLGVVYDSRGLVEVGGLFYIGVAYAGAGFDDGDLGVVANEVDQRLRTTWNQNIHIARGRQQFGNVLAIRRQ